MDGPVLRQVPEMATKCGFLASHRKESRASHNKEKESLFREIHTLQSECGPFQKVRDPDLSKILFSSCEVTQVCQAILQLWWVEPNIGGADAASWRTNTFCMSYIDCLIFCQNFS